MRVQIKWVIQIRQAFKFRLHTHFDRWVSTTLNQMSMTRHLGKSRCLHELLFIRPPNFSVKVRSLAAREKRKYERPAYILSIFITCEYKKCPWLFPKLLWFKFVLRVFSGNNHFKILWLFQVFHDRTYRASKNNSFKYSLSWMYQNQMRLPLPLTFIYLFLIYILLVFRISHTHI